MSTISTPSTVDAFFNLKITTYNTYWFFDDKNTLGDLIPANCRAYFRPTAEKAKDLAKVIAELSPTILCLQEIQDDTVLSVLVEILKKEHNLSYSHHWSGVRSERNAQSVGLLIQDTFSSSSSPVKVEKMGTYLWPTDPIMTERLPTLPSFSELPPEARSQFLNKVIWVKFTLKDTDFLLINLHLKASGDDTSKKIRTIEAIMLQRLVQSLQQEEGGVFEDRRVIIAGDFNDIDEDLTPSPKNIGYTTALKMIKEAKEFDLKGLELVNSLSFQEDRISMVFYPVLIDFILLDKKLLPSLQKANMETLLMEGVFPSDHWPVTVVLSIPSSSSSSSVAAAASSPT